MTTAFQPNAFQSDGFQIAGGVAATDFQITITIVQESDGLELDLRLPATNKGAGRKRRRERYIARYKNQYHQFETVEDLEEFVAQAKLEEAEKPKRNRAPIKITLSPEFKEEIPAEVNIPLRMESMPTGVALAQIRKLDYSLEKFLAQAIRKAEEEDEEMLMLLL